MKSGKQYKISFNKEIKKNKQSSQILELEKTMTELKNSIEIFNRRLDQRRKKSMISKTDHLKLSCSKNNNNKKRECRKPMGPLGHH